MASLEIPASQRRILEEWSTREGDPALAHCARIVLKAGEGVPSTRIARELGVSRPTVTLWPRRFQEDGLDEVAEIRARLVVSPRMVDSHLERVYRQPHIGSRWERREFAEGLPELQFEDA